MWAARAANGKYLFPNEKTFREVERIFWHGKRFRWGDKRWVRWAGIQRFKGLKDGGNEHAVWYLHRMYYDVLPRYRRRLINRSPELKYLDELGS